MKRFIVVLLFLCFISACCFSFPIISEAYGDGYIDHSTITVRTADEFCAGTDEEVYICLNGSVCSSGFIKLDNENNNFERGCEDVFYYSSGGRLGTLKSIDLKYEGDDLWCCEWVRVNDICFNIGSRFLKNETVHVDCVDRDYSVTITMSPFFTADPDAQVSVSFCGKYGWSETMLLNDDDYDDYLPGSTHTYTRTSVDVGACSGYIVYVSGSLNFESFSSDGKTNVVKNLHITDSQYFAGISSLGDKIYVSGIDVYIGYPDITSADSVIYEDEENHDIQYIQVYTNDPGKAMSKISTFEVKRQFKDAQGYNFVTQKIYQYNEDGTFSDASASWDYNYIVYSTTRKSDSVYFMELYLDTKATYTAKGKDPSAFTDSNGKSYYIRTVKYDKGSVASTFGEPSLMLTIGIIIAVALLSSFVTVLVMKKKQKKAILTSPDMSGAAASAESNVKSDVDGIQRSDKT